MNEIIQNILSDIESIRTSLNIISTKGVSIIDSYSLKSATKNIITTFIGTGIGTGFTMWLFKRQEKIRIKAELRLDFYNEYEGKYKDILICLDKFKRNIGGAIENFYSIGPDIRVHMFEKINTQEDIIKNFESQRVQKAIISTNELVVKMEDLESFMKSKEVIHGYNEFKFKEGIEVFTSIKNKFKELEGKSELAKTFKYILSNGGNVETKQDYTGKTFNVGISEEVCESNIEKYKIAYRELIEICKTENISKIETNIQKNNKEIQNEFIGKYFA